MGTYVNPESESMRLAVNSPIYVDKTGLLKILNKSIDTEKHFFAVSLYPQEGRKVSILP